MKRKVNDRWIQQSEGNMGEVRKGNNNTTNQAVGILGKSSASHRRQPHKRLTDKQSRSIVVAIQSQVDDHPT